jgi:hypothetical protein
MEADSDAAAQQIPSLLRNSKACYDAHNFPPVVFILSQLDSVHISTPVS